MQSLTGGTLLARDREFIVLYRGKDFLPPAVSSAIEERRKYGMHGKKPRSEHSPSVTTAQDELESTSSVPNEHNDNNDHRRGLLAEPRKPAFTETFVRRTSLKLSMVWSF